ncbi:MAG: hypothetical protein A3F70_13310 [Acidobacteria bacterium RIFCSPLOWO2_12_FULL_67_14]|nr:MAG: hypothetical protein A3H29_13000 [Acidobacteria bacterium RIFCSPLOWO2_02_FULL_67_21]OFW39190.1 MAG: hypothetical protein A3F70_13310 [Acidobacteria bacterium RIFCSPLOWO2_12_FULL_67_14]
MLEPARPPLADHFTQVFRQEHRGLRDGLLELSDAFTARDLPRIRQVLHAVAAASGPHFRYEEESLYPGLTRIFGWEYVGKLLTDHDRVITAARRLVALAEQSELTPAEAVEAVRLVRSILPHVSDCDGLSIMVERFSESHIRAVLESREMAIGDGHDLFTWADRLRPRAA